MHFLDESEVKEEKENQGHCCSECGMVTVEEEKKQNPLSSEELSWLTWQ